MKNILTTFVLVICGGYNLTAQLIIDYSEEPDSIQLQSLSALNEGGNSYLPTVIPPSPQSQLFKMYLDHPVTEYSGLADIEIPLYEIKLKNMTIPLSLSYHAGGIKFRQDDGDVGVGWTIRAGGYRIMRTIHGEADEEYPFFNQSEADHYYRQGSHEWVKYLYNVGAIGDHKLMPPYSLKHDNTPPYPYPQDGEYDQLTYLLPTSSGNFIITDRASRSVAIMECNQDIIKVDPSEPSTANIQMRDFSITDDAGNLYHLGRYPNAGDFIFEQFNSSYNTAWPVTRITTPYNEKVDFTYIKQNYKPVYTSPMGLIDEPPFDGYVSSSYDGYIESAQFGISGMSSHNNICLVTKIETDNETVTFTRDPEDNFITGITVISKADNRTVRSVSMTYDTATISMPQNFSHMRLRSVKVDDEKYDLHYYDAPPQWQNWGVVYPDMWGYYLGHISLASSVQTAPLFLPEELGNIQVVAMVHNNVSGINFSTRSISSYGPDQIRLINANRPNSDAPNYFSLKKIVYPTGGSSVFEYESNQYLLTDGITIETGPASA